MGLLHATVAARTNDECCPVVKAMLQHHVSGNSAGMETNSNVKMAAKVLQVALEKQKETCEKI